MKMYVGGEWIDKRETIPVRNPFDGSVIDTIPKADADDVERALATAVRGAQAMRRLTGFERFQMLRKASDLLLERSEEFARIITLEEGKIIGEARVEVTRAAEIIALSGGRGEAALRGGDPARRRARGEDPDGIHPPRAVRRGRRDQPVQLPAAPGVP